MATLIEIESPRRSKPTTLPNCDPLACLRDHQCPVSATRRDGPTAQRRSRTLTQPVPAEEPLEPLPDWMNENAADVAAIFEDLGDRVFQRCCENVSPHSKPLLDWQAELPVTVALALKQLLVYWNGCDSFESGLDIGRTDVELLASRPRQRGPSSPIVAG